MRQKRTLKVLVLCPRSYHFDIIRKGQCQCFECMWEIVPAGNHCTFESSPPTLTLETSPERYSLTHCMTTTTKAEGHICQKKPVVDGVKSLGKINADNIDCVAVIHHACHRVLEDQQIGETGPTG